MYDLNIAWSPTTSETHLRNTLAFASSLGYKTVALSHTLSLPLPSDLSSPIPKLSGSSSQTLADKSTGKTTPPAHKDASSTLQRDGLPHILHRATLPLSDPSTNYRLPALAAAYDILAIRPQTDKAFQNACLNLDIALISLDLAASLPFHFRPKPCMAAVTRGVRFEISYAQALNADARGRANFIANATGLIRATRGRGIVVSSEAASSLGLRAPADVVNLLSVWGLESGKGLEALRAIPRSVVANEAIKRSGFRGVIDIVQVPKPPAKEVDGEDDGTGATENESKPDSSKGNSQKRKNNQGLKQPPDARQPKKMKVANRAAK